MKSQQNNDFPTEKELRRIGWLLTLFVFSVIISGIILLIKAWS